MATIKIKRGLSASVSNLVLQNGELALATDTGRLYAGTPTGSICLNPTGGTADTAAKLNTPREFSIVGDGISQAVTFDGGQNVQLDLSLATITGLTAGTYTKLGVNKKGIVTSASQLQVSDIPTIPVSKVSGLGDVATKNTGTAVGNIVAVGSDGKINAALIPDLAIMDVFEADSQEKMLALVCQKGDICVRTDEGKTYILTDTPATQIANWKWLRTPDCQIQSVNGKTGNVTLTYSDVGALPVSHSTTYASTSAYGHVKIGDGLSVENGIVSIKEIDGGTF